MYLIVWKGIGHGMKPDNALSEQQQEVVIDVQ